MKRVSCIIIFVFACAVAFAQSSQLPKAANDFISTYFTDSQVTNVIDVSSSINPYRVEVSPDFTIIFDASGNWQTIETAGSTLPETLLQDNTKSYILSKYEKLGMIMRISKVGNKKEVTFFDGVIFSFNETGSFERIVKN